MLLRAISPFRSLNHIHNYMYHPLCHLHSSGFCPRSVCIYVFHKTLNKQRLHTFPSPAFNRSVFVRETKCISCKIRTELFVLFSKIFILEGRAMVQAVTRGPFTSEARIRSQDSPCMIVDDKVAMLQGFLPVLRSPLTVSFQHCSI